MRDGGEDLRVQGLATDEQPVDLRLLEQAARTSRADAAPVQGRDAARIRSGGTQAGANRGAAYAEIVRWNGKIADFTSLARRVGSQFGVKHGDIVEATIVDNVITSYVNGVEVLSVTDDAVAQGSPGVGFNFFVGNTNVDHGFSSFEVDTYDD